MVTTSRFKRFFLIALCASISLQAQAGFWDSCTSYALRAFGFVKEHKAASAILLSGIAASAVTYWYISQKNIVTYPEMPGLQQFIVNQQTGSSCGYHVVANAKAIQEIIMSKSLLVPSQVSKIASALYSQRPNDAETEIGDLTLIAPVYGVQNIYFLQYIEANDDLKSVGLLMDNALNYEPLLEAYKNKTDIPRLVHFICHSNNNGSHHWTLVSVICDENNQLSMIYCDSLNRPLEDVPVRYAMVKKLYETIINEANNGIKPERKSRIRWLLKS